MAYTKTNWTSSTPINAANLNNMENGISENDKLLTKEKTTKDNLVIYKTGNIVELRYNISESVTVAGWEEKTIATIEEKYRPNENVYFSLQGYAAQSTLFGTIKPNGNITLTNWTSDSQTAINVYFDKMYIV